MLSLVFVTILTTELSRLFALFDWWFYRTSMIFCNLWPIYYYIFLSSHELIAGHILDRQILQMSASLLLPSQCSRLNYFTWCSQKQKIKQLNELMLVLDHMTRRLMNTCASTQNIWFDDWRKIRLFVELLVIYSHTTECIQMADVQFLENSMLTLCILKLRLAQMVPYDEFCSKWCFHIHWLLWLLFLKLLQAPFVNCTVLSYKSVGLLEFPYSIFCFFIVFLFAWK